MGCISVLSLTSSSTVCHLCYMCDITRMKLHSSLTLSLFKTKAGSSKKETKLFCVYVRAGSFCQSCLQECLRPQKPVCAVCRAGLGHWTRAAELEALIQASRAACKGCGIQVRIDDIQEAHVRPRCWLGCGGSSEVLM